MKRIALIAASSAAALAATLAIAQPQPIPPAGGSGGDATRQERTEQRDQRRSEWRERRAEQMQQRMNERLAKLRADLKLKPDQVPLFDTLENVIKQGAQQRRERWASMREQRENFRHADIMERLDGMASRQAERAQRTKALADATRPLWTTLSDEQKTVMRRSVREAFAMARQRMERMRERFEDRRGGRDDHEDRGRRWRDRWHDNDDRG
ncbi:Spy/CpxP family protein refolding chaperone [Bosea sp. BK604]|uniref:Spy/CpxP family protein refolding chaperone n=1 Tax=Bosea sp. BK604 TaxID=2512180 RepID=UPI00104AF9E3|nr:Spy/CpxP family protein refolding chaperone [Bosea sp. BK604]TCR63529.1 LTXXQ motif family protein [Bosea sp. BK604]